MPAKKALLILDAQVAMFNLGMPLHDGEAVLEQIRALVDEARSAGAPIVYLQHSGREGSVFARGSPGWEIHPAITPAEGEMVVEKRTADGFAGTSSGQ